MPDPLLQDFTEGVRPGGFAAAWKPRKGSQSASRTCSARCPDVVLVLAAAGEQSVQPAVLRDGAGEGRSRPRAAT